MKKIALSALLLALPIFFAPIAHAADSVSSTIINNVNTSSSTNTSSSKCHTSVSTNVNGNASNYESEDCGSVSVNNENGTTTIKKNGMSVTSAPTSMENTNESVSPTVTKSPAPTISNEQTLKVKMEANQSIIQKFFERLRSIIFFWHHSG